MSARNDLVPWCRTDSQEEWRWCYIYKRVFKEQCTCLSCYYNSDRRINALLTTVGFSVNALAACLALRLAALSMSMTSQYSYAKRWLTYELYSFVEKSPTISRPKMKSEVSKNRTVSSKPISHTQTDNLHAKSCTVAWSTLHLCPRHIVESLDIFFHSTVTEQTKTVY